MTVNPHGWMGGPGSGPIFEPSSLPSEEVEKEFSNRLTQLCSHLEDPDQTHFRATVLDIPNNTKIYLREFAAWTVSEMKWEDLPPKLGAMGKRLDKNLDTALATSTSTPKIPKKRTSELDAVITEASQLAKDSTDYHSLESAEFSRDLIQEAKRKNPTVSGSWRLVMNFAKILV
jgi:hypothetical protein